MAFSITLYNITDDPKKINKTLGSGYSVNAVPTEACDILTPSFILDYSSNVGSYNYCEVGAPFNRFYFITDMKIDVGNKMIINCTVDPLYTYKDAINNINTTIFRTEEFSKSAPYLPDTEYQVKSGFQYYYEAFTNSGGFTPAFNPLAGYYVLSWVGDPATDEEVWQQIYSEPSDWETSWGDYYYRDGSGAEEAFYNLLTLYPFSAPPFDEALIEVGEEYNSGIYRRITT